MDGFDLHHREITTASKEAQKFFDQGLTLAYGFNHGEAAAFFRKAAELDPSNLEAHADLGFAWLNAGEAGRAAGELALAVEAEPGVPELRFGLGAALVRAGRYGQARPHLEAVLRQAPGHSGALNYLGMIHDLSGDAEGAAALYRQALAADSGNASARANLAAVLPKLSKLSH